MRAAHDAIAAMVRCDTTLGLNICAAYLDLYDEVKRLRADPITTPAQMREARNAIYIDCEFDGHGGPLLSLAMVREFGPSAHVRVAVVATDPWVVKNVIPLMQDHEADEIYEYVSPNEVGAVIRRFIGDDCAPTIIADSPVDIGYFCAALSTGDDGRWSSTDYPLMRLIVHNVDCYPTRLTRAVQHNAWWDAMALREAVRALPVAEPAPVAVRVKPLVWQMEKGRQDDCPKWIADVDAKRYEVFKAWWGDQDKWGFVALGEFYHTEDAAKAAAEADHAVRVLSQIEALPAAQVRAEALREAARECDKLAGDPRMYGAERRRAAGQCAATIRALIEKKTT